MGETGVLRPFLGLVLGDTLYFWVVLIYFSLSLLELVSVFIGDRKKTSKGK